MRARGRAGARAGVRMRVAVRGDGGSGGSRCEVRVRGWRLTAPRMRSQITPRSSSPNCRSGSTMKADTLSAFRTLPTARPRVIVCSSW